MDKKIWITDHERRLLRAAFLEGYQMGHVSFISTAEMEPYWREHEAVTYYADADRFVDPPPFEHYRLPGGRIVPVDATASKGAAALSYTLPSGAIVTAVRVEPAL